MKNGQTLHVLSQAGSWRGCWGAQLSPQDEQRSLDTSLSQLLLRASHQRLLGGMAGQISLMSEAPVLIGALCSAVPSQAFIFNAGKGWIFFLSHSHAFLPWLMAPHSERPLH